MTPHVHFAPDSKLTPHSDEWYHEQGQIQAAKWRFQSEEALLDAIATAQTRADLEAILREIREDRLNFVCNRRYILNEVHDRATEIGVTLSTGRRLGVGDFKRK
ncbi:hypothetical protein GCM10027299_09530 [Larkinella ripae]